MQGLLYVHVFSKKSTLAVQFKHLLGMYFVGYPVPHHWNDFGIQNEAADDTVIFTQLLENYTLQNQSVSRVFCYENRFFFIFKKEISVICWYLFIYFSPSLLQPEFSVIVRMWCLFGRLCSKYKLLRKNINSSYLILGLWMRKRHPNKIIQLLFAKFRQRNYKLWCAIYHFSSSAWRI